MIHVRVCICNRGSLSLSLSLSHSLLFTRSFSQHFAFQYSLYPSHRMSAKKKSSTNTHYHNFTTSQTTWSFLIENKLFPHYEPGTQEFPVDPFYVQKHTYTIYRFFYSSSFRSEQVICFCFGVAIMFFFFLSLYRNAIVVSFECANVIHHCMYRWWWQRKLIHYKMLFCFELPCCRMFMSPEWIWIKNLLCKVFWITI